MQNSTVCLCQPSLLLVVTAHLVFGVFARQLLLFGIVFPLASILAKLSQHSADIYNLIFSTQPLPLWPISAPLIRSPLRCFINLFIYVLTYLLTYFSTDSFMSPQAMPAAAALCFFYIVSLSVPMCVQCQHRFARTADVRASQSTAVPTWTRPQAG